MARQFDGIDDVIAAAITAMDSGDWTIAVWVNPTSAGEGSGGVFVQIETSGGGIRQRFRFPVAGRTVQALQSYTGGAGNAVTTTTNTLPTAAWSLVVATFRASDKMCRVYIGDLDSPMVEASYSAQVAGGTTRGTAGTVANIGNNSATSATQVGSLGQVAIAAREWSLDEMEAFRLGVRPVNSGAMRGFWPLDSPTAAQAEDLSGNGANGTVTGAVVSEDPPVPLGWGEMVQPVLVVVAGATVTGTAAANLGGLAATAAGTPKVAGTATASLGGLAATATGMPSVAGSATAALSALTATATGTASALATATASFGGLTATATGVGSISATMSASLGGLSASASGTPTVTGSALASLGGLTASAAALRGVYAVAVAELGTLLASMVGSVVGAPVLVADLNPKHLLFVEAGADIDHVEPSASIFYSEPHFVLTTQE